jgi:hypothetical protein
MLRVPVISGTIVSLNTKSLIEHILLALIRVINTLSLSIKVIHVGFDETLDHEGVRTKSFVNPDKLIDNCEEEIHDGFDSTWDHARSLLNPDRLMDDYVVAIHDGLD